MLVLWSVKSRVIYYQRWFSLVDWLILTACNPSRVILCQEVRESCSWYVHIYIFLCSFFLKSNFSYFFFWHTVLPNTNDFQTYLFDPLFMVVFYGITILVSYSMFIHIYQIFRIFKLVTSALLLYSQYFGWHILQPSSGISCQTRVYTNLKLNLFLNHKNRLFQFC